MARYAASSPYYSTENTGSYLSVLTFRAIPKEADDILYVIKSQHALRPDLLAFDLYNDPGLWWVFAARNPNSLEDPIFDFQAGVAIYLPKFTTLVKALGI